MSYTISQAAEKMNLTSPTLRYYDKEGLLPFVGRSPSGIRMFKDSDLEWLNLIECLKSTGMPIKDIKQFIDWYMEGDSTLKERSQMFHERKTALERQLNIMNEMLDIVTYKCWYCDKAVEVGSTVAVDNLNLDEIPKEVKKGKERLGKRS